MQIQEKKYSENRRRDSVQKRSRLKSPKIEARSVTIIAERRRRYVPAIDRRALVNEDSAIPSPAHKTSNTINIAVDITSRNPVATRMAMLITTITAAMAVAIIHRTVQREGGKKHHRTHSARAPVKTIRVTKKQEHVLFKVLVVLVQCRRPRHCNLVPLKILGAPFTLTAFQNVLIVETSDGILAYFRT
jgi:hypothetical protein